MNKSHRLTLDTNSRSPVGFAAMTVRSRSLLAVVVAFLFLAGQTCVLPIPGSASTTDEEHDAHAAPSAASASSSTDGHDHEHDSGSSVHCADSATGNGASPRAPIVSTILARYTPVAPLLQVVGRTLDAPADVGGPPLFLLYAALLI
jgi:hypothetical protein